MKIRTVGELTIGVLYAIGAVTQALFVLRDSSEYYVEMAGQAWIAPAATFVEELLVPNSFAITIMVVAFEVGLALSILTRGTAVRPALIAGGIFSIVGALTGNPAETVGYGVLAVMHFRLASRRRPLDPMGDQAY